MPYPSCRFSVRGSSLLPRLISGPAALFAPGPWLRPPSSKSMNLPEIKPQGENLGWRGQGLKYLSLPLRSLGSWWKWFPSEAGFKQNPSLYLSPGHHSCPPSIPKAQWPTTISTGTRREWYYFCISKGRKYLYNIFQGINLADNPI